MCHCDVEKCTGCQSEVPVSYYLCPSLEDGGICMEPDSNDSAAIKCIIKSSNGNKKLNLFNILKRKYTYVESCIHCSGY